MRRSVAVRLKLRFVRSVVLGSAAAALLCSPAPASAQLSRVGGSIPALEPGGIMRGTDTSYDPVHDIYLELVGNGPIYGVFVNSSGYPVTSGFTIMMNDSATWGHFPRAEYSPHVSNGAGGQGGFLVTWNHNVGNTNYVFGRLVSYNAPGRLVSGIQLISDGEQGGTWHETGPAMAYSRTSGRFLVAWRTLQYGVRGRFVDTNGVPAGGVMQLENPGGSRDPALAWNAATNEFGLVYTGFGGSGAFAAFRRIRASDGAISGRTTFGFSAGTFATAIDVNSTSQYVLAWARHPGTMTATFDQNGTQLATNFVTDRLGFDQSLGLAFNPSTGTFLAVSSDRDTLEIGAVEVTGSGAPASGFHLITNGARSGSFHPLISARPGTNQWDVAYSRDFRGVTSQIVASGGSGGSPPPPPPPTTPPPSGGTSSSGCSTPDPFVSIGGGTCINGGWRPGGSGSPAPPPPSSPPPSSPPPSSRCTTGAPASGWVCVNGGWLPPGHPLTRGSAPAPTPAPAAPVPPASGCSTSDPFASIGGGTCVNGGWVVGRSSACSGSDPFASIGGGICVGGGWVPSAGGCTGSDPFAAIGGGVCIRGGWLPRAGRAP